MIDEDAIRQRWEAVSSKLDERGRRLFAAGEVRTAGWGGLAMVSQITGLARSTINRGENDLDAAPLPKGRVRRAGGGRRAVSQNDPGLVPALERALDRPARTIPVPFSLVRWRLVGISLRPLSLLAPVARLQPVCANRLPRSVRCSRPFVPSVSPLQRSRQLPTARPTVSVRTVVRWWRLPLSWRTPL